MKQLLRQSVAACALYFSAAPFPSAFGAEQGPLRCDTESLQSVAPADTTVGFAARGSNYCQVYGHVTTRDPGPNKVLFVLALPANFNGRYLYAGVGGAAGYLPDLNETLLRQGYAIAGSDGGSGAQPNEGFSFQSDPARGLDYAHRGVHVSAVATQALTKAFYRTNASFRRYIAGCSGGGGMAVRSAINYGTSDFDGFVVGAHPWYNDAMDTQMVKIAQHLQKNPAGWIPADLLKRAEAAILEAYDETDGARDGMIHDLKDGKNFDFDILRKVGFSEAQIETVKFIAAPRSFAGPVAPPNRMYPGYTLNHVSAWQQQMFGQKPPPWKSGVYAGAPGFHSLADTKSRARIGDRAYTDDDDFPSKEDLEQFAKTATKPDPFGFDAFVKGGGKVIFWNGDSDQFDTPFETIIGFQELAAKYPSAKDWARLFIVPGLHHCAGGPGPEDVEARMIESIVAWVEKGASPESVVTNRLPTAAGGSHSFLMCAWPQREHLKAGAKDPNKAENWECRNP